MACRCILGVKLSDEDILEFLEQLADTGGSSTIPPPVLRVLNNKACRGAIMFGDSLLPSECALIVEELKQTSLCLQVQSTGPVDQVTKQPIKGRKCSGAIRFGEMERLHKCSGYHIADV